MTGRTYEIESLPSASLDAAAAFVADHLSAIESLIEQPDLSVLAVLLPVAGTDHRDWRKAVARDLARKYAPRRVNLIAGPPGPARDETLAYLWNASGVTGHYCETHEQA